MSSVTWDHTVLDSLPSGANVIGHVIVDQMPSVSINASGLSVSVGAVGISGALPAGSNNIGHVTVDAMPAIPLDFPSPITIQGGVFVSGALPNITLSNLPLPVNLIPSGNVNVSVQNFPSPVTVQGGVSISGTLPNVTLNNLPLPVNLIPSGNINVSVQNFPVSQDVLVTNFPNPLTVNGVVDISGNPQVQVSNFPANQSATVTVIPHDSNNIAASGTVLSYTANPSVGSAVGTVRSGYYAVPTSGTPTTMSLPVIWDFGDRPSQTIVLRGTAQQIAINLNASNPSTTRVDASFEWTEE